jgi:plasmid maintenance system killer protein
MAKNKKTLWIMDSDSETLDWLDLLHEAREQADISLKGKAPYEFFEKDLPKLFSYWVSSHLLMFKLEDEVSHKKRYNISSRSQTVKSARR